MLLAVIGVVYTWSFIDRQVLTLLVQPIKADLGLSDTRMGLLLGFSFALFYSLMNLPAGYLIDRYNRRGLIAIGAVVWSAMTIVCGFARSFGQLFAGRAGVGFSESVIAPASFSLIRDAVEPSRRASAYSVLAMAPYAGSALALLLGGALLAAASDGRFSAWPVLGAMKPWQCVLIIVGAAGFPLTLLLFLVKEPARRVDVQGAKPAGYGQVWSHMKANGWIYFLLLSFTTLQAMLTFGSSAWLPALASRQWGLSPPQVGRVMGLAYLILPPIGLFAGGFVMDWLTARGRSLLDYGILASVISLIAIVAIPFAPTVELMWVAICVKLAFAGSFYAVGATILAQVTPSHLMGKQTALYLLAQNLIGQGMGPMVVALLSDRFFEGGHALGYGLATMAVVVGILATLVGVALRSVLMRWRSVD
ncbi:MFS transporter [Caulobacter sp. AP07]|uniref:MFS transporter n=1 Tax=Caulobacter sp. AP07 TaxID=1144304 RepID=UPI0003080D7B|nr:MFS transporter [Caulobacter sp. AP07]